MNSPTRTTTSTPGSRRSEATSPIVQAIDALLNNNCSYFSSDSVAFVSLDESLLSPLSTRYDRRHIAVITRMSSFITPTGWCHRSNGLCGNCVANKNVAYKQLIDRTLHQRVPTVLSCRFGAVIMQQFGREREGRIQTIYRSQWHLTQFPFDNSGVPLQDGHDVHIACEILFQLPNPLLDHQ